MEANWEAQMYHGKINPVAGIFLGKNQFDYLDRIEHLVTARYDDTGDYDEKALRERYYAADDEYLPEPNDSGSDSGSDFDSH